MEIELGYGTATQRICVPDSNLVGVLRPHATGVTSVGSDVGADVGAGVDMSPGGGEAIGSALVARALQEPIGAPKLSETPLAGQKVAIVTSDITRPVPSHDIIPKILDELEKAGVRQDDITVVFGLGIHRRQTPEEMRGLVGPQVYDSVRCVDGDLSDVVHMGTTSFGTPVDITRIVAEADFRIGVGNIEYHYFAGYSGGAKAIMPGVSTQAAIQSNHSRMVLPEAAAGRLEGNPVREDIEEAIEHCPLHFIVNVVLGENKEIVHAVAGDYIKAHREGCKVLDSLYRMPIDAPADIVVSSQGGHPKDLDLYQTQKALDNAKHAVRDGGVVVLVGSCREGFGEKVMEEWMREAISPEALIERIEQDFQLGGHKAAAIALVLQRADVHLVSDMDEGLVESIFLKPFPTAQEALDAAFEKLGSDATVLVMPYGGATLPVVTEYYNKEKHVDE